MNTDYVFLKEFEKKRNGNFNFYFWGHSLDRSDADYINEVFDFVHSLTSREKKIIIIYHSKVSKDKMLINLLSIRGKHDISDLMREKILLFFKSDSIELKREIKRNINPQPINIG